MGKGKLKKSECKKSGHANIQLCKEDVPTESWAVKKEISTNRAPLGPNQILVRRPHLERSRDRRKITIRYSSYRTWTRGRKIRLLLAPERETVTRTAGAVFTYQASVKNEK